MFLILDVRKSGEPYWVKSDLLYKAVSRIDNGTQRSRGYIVIDSVPTNRLS